MGLFRVTWVIDLDGDTPVEAACDALAMVRDREAQATVFTVAEYVGGGLGFECEIDAARPEDFCRCGHSLDDGQGWNGECGDCADRTDAARADANT